MLCSCLPKSPDTMPYDYLFWGYVKDTICDIIKHRGFKSLNAIGYAWNEFEFHLDIVRLAKRSHT